jgi:L-lactate dehydrogenase complex protein LldG
MFEQFKARAEGVSAEVYRFETKDIALDFIVGFLQREGLADEPQAHALWADCPFLDGIDRQPLAAVAGLKFQVTQELAAGARFGISQMQWALADTGTLVQDSSAVDQRLVSSLPTIHIALMPTSGLLPDMPTLLTRLKPDSPVTQDKCVNEVISGQKTAENNILRTKSAYIAMITGPSRTADIERVLTIGVHGPERLVIVFVDDLGGAN